MPWGLTRPWNHDRAIFFKGIKIIIDLVKGKGLTKDLKCYKLVLRTELKHMAKAKISWKRLDACKTADVGCL